tara:strand:- start:48 stop:260 length:213 start_codon:yes stop_codon:yes gene_type:complete
LRNKSVKSEIKTLTKKFYSLIEDQDRVGAEAVFTDITSRLDKAAKNNLFHKNNVAKQKSAIAKSLGALKG